MLLMCWFIIRSQMMESEPKTVQDYKDVVKILKLKIIKQNKRIQELQTKNKTFEDQLNGVTLRGDDLQLSSRLVADLEINAADKREQREAELGTLRGKAEVVGLFARGLKKLGLTPQAVFRVADFAYKNYVQSEYFREVVGKLRVGLSAKEVSCLIFVFDEAYSGFITRDDYLNSLSAYKVSAEHPHPPFLQECAFKLAQLLHADKVNLLKFYEEMEGRSRQGGRKGIDLNLFAEQVRKGYGGRLCEREVVGAFNAIDLQAVGAVERSNFLYCLTSHINKLLAGEDAVSRKTQQEWNNPNARSQYVPEPLENAKTTPKRFEKENPNEASKVAVLPYTPKDDALERLQGEYRVSLQAVFQEILLDPLSSRLTMKNFKKHLLALNSQLPSGLLSDLYREIDSATKGSIYFSELTNYYLAHSPDTDILLRIIGKYLYAHDLDSEKFWFMFGLAPEAEISKAKFMEVMGKTFETKGEKAWEGLWSSFDKGRGTCALASIIRTFRKYEIE